MVTLTELHDKNDMPQPAIINSFSITYDKVYVLYQNGNAHYLLLKEDGTVMIHTFENMYSKTQYGVYYYDTLNTVTDVLKFMERILC